MKHITLTIPHIFKFFLIILFAVTLINKADATYITTPSYINTNYQIPQTKSNGTKVVDIIKKNESQTTHTKNIIKNV